MGSENFYIHLSNNIIATSPQEMGNTIGCFNTRLNRRLNLNEEWEVALTDISYTKSWYNIMEDQKLYIMDEQNDLTLLDEVLPAGNYETIDELIEVINALYAEVLKYQRNIKVKYPPFLSYNKPENKIRVRLGSLSDDKYISPIFESYLAHFLGLTDSQNRQYPLSYEPIKNIKLIPLSQIRSEPIREPIALPSAQESVQNKPPIEDEVTIKVVTVKNSDSLNESSDPNIWIIDESKLSRPLTEHEKKNMGPMKGILTAQEYIDMERKFNNSDDTNNGQMQSTAPYMISASNNLPVNNTIVISNKPTNEISVIDELVNATYIDGFKEVSLHGTIRSLYVYCGIIKPVLVGNYEVPLIRRVEIPTNKFFGETCEINYTNPQYYPLVAHEINAIEIDIKDDTGKTIDFAFGRTAVTLHFRKKLHNVFESVYQLLR